MLPEWIKKHLNRSENFLNLSDPLKLPTTKHPPLSNLILSLELVLSVLKTLSKATFINGRFFEMLQILGSKNLVKDIFFTWGHVLENLKRSKIERFQFLTLFCSKSETCFFTWFSLEIACIHVRWTNWSLPATRCEQNHWWAIQTSWD